MRHRRGEAASRRRYGSSACISKDGVGAYARGGPPSSRIPAGWSDKMKLVSSKTEDVRDTAEQQARIDRAAAHRLAVLQGFNEGIFNHFTLAVPGRSDGFLL